MSQNTTAIAIAANIAKLKSLVESGEFTVEDIADTQEGDELALGDKMDGIAGVSREIEGERNMLIEEVKRLNARIKTCDNKIKNLKSYALLSMLTAGLKTLKTTFNTFSVRKGSVSVVIDNVDQLPDELVDVATVVAPDKKKIKEAIEAGTDVKGAHLEIGAESLQVR
ncbi:siphovirus Gp157 family protein [Salmonella enterica subsp. enterica]|nr:siphovirus Gp157 family protein [Salmonella enterica subsp. enterica serovar Langford]